ncbi:MAG: hypothetical protein RLZ44_1561 [Pseudomonadota bacterium]
MNADLVLFAIRGALQVGSQARVACVNSAKRTALVLPLPDFNRAPSFSAAVDFFADLQHEGPAQLVALIRKIRDNEPFATEEREQLIEYHNDELAKAAFGGADFKNLDDGTALSAESFNALVTIAQWQRGADPNPTVLQSIAGSLLDVCVDYFVQTPDSLDASSRKGRALKSFLTALDDISFAQAPVKQLPRKLMIGVLETIDANPDLLTSDSRYQEIIGCTARSLVTDVGARLIHVEDDLTRTERIEAWGESVFRSVLSSTGQLILSDTGRYLGVDDKGRQALVECTGHAILGMVDKAPQGGLEAVFSGANLEQLVDTVLLVLAENPSLVTADDSRLGPLIASAAADIAAIDALEHKGLVPEVVRLIVSATGENADLIWPNMADPAGNLALTAARTVISVITEPPPAGAAWKVRLSDADIAQVTETVLVELASNPAWLIDELGHGESTLQAVLQATFGVIRARGQNILSKQSGLHILQASIQAVAQRRELARKLPNGDALVAAVIDACLASLLNTGNESALWQLARGETLEAVLDVTLQAISRIDFSAISPTAVVSLVDLVLQEHVALLQGGAAWDAQAFAGALEAKLNAGD